ncbi:META domain-containing protein [Hymenobacter jejuensis]|uniref:META domain-containing protein n=1 Tax=Hymenobacter jejuensis TaxID=2502781 RepID=A0A5B8A010_9BACT|nr:META domain-containing protein [Hymenobacter jejuensis]QDA60568.1 META domain-containing protein [Hymenobacter jejuensis]
MHGILPSLLVAATLILTASCQEDATGPDDLPLLDTHWVLRQVDGKTALLTEKGAHMPDLTLLAAANHTRGQGTCNWFGGSYALAEGTQRLTISEQGSTYINCPNQNLEATFLLTLPLTTHYEITGRTLRLYDDEHTEARLTFEAETK